MNQIMELIYQQIKVGIMDTTSVGTLHVDTDENDESAMLSLGQGEAYQVITMLGRELLPTEAACTPLEYHLLIARWVIYKLSSYVLWLLSITVALPHH